MNISLDEVGQQIKLLRWVKAQRAELDDMEKEARSVLEEYRDTVKSSGTDDITGTLKDKPVVVWKKTSARRLNQRRLRETYAGVYELCIDVVAGERMELIEE